MDFASSSVISESPNIMELGLLLVNPTDKLGSILGPNTIVEGIADGSDWIVSRHGFEEVTVERVSEVKVFSDYI